MYKAFTGKTYTSDRENLWRKFEFGGYNTKLFLYHIPSAPGYNIDRISLLKTALIDIDSWQDPILLLSALENARGGSTLLDYSSSGDTNILTPSWTIDPDADYHYLSSGGAKIYGKRNTTTDVPHLKFISSSSRYLSTGVLPTGSNPDLSIICHITPLVVGQEQYIFSLEDSFLVYIDSDDYVNFYISDGVDTYTGKSTNKVAVNTQSRIVCIKDDATDKMIIHVDSTKTEISSIAIEPLLSSNDLFIGCKDVSGSKSNYLDACLHTIAVCNHALTDAEIALIDDSIDPIGLEVVHALYDDGSGTDTGIPFGMKSLEYRFPTYEYLDTLTRTATALEVTHA